MTESNSLLKSKPHYKILDGLRGVAALVVVLFHVLEIYSGGDHTKQLINHGYLAVDFFFILSGYVISYAYDDRWNIMSLGHFFKRRIIRLQPMLIFGSIFGAVLFYFQYSEILGWSRIAETPVWKVVFLMIMGCFLIPVGKGLDIRGWNEMFPLNGPAWTLFFEEIANISYALILRRLSNKMMSILVLIAMGITVQYALTNPHGDIIGGWAIDDPAQLKIGFTRLAFPFLAGILLARTVKVSKLKNSFLYTSILLITCLSVPRIGGHENFWQNGLYECFCLIVVFPFIVWMGASGEVTGKIAKLSKFLGDISYPIYITHFPIVYIYMAWVSNNNYTLEESWPFAILTMIISIIVAFVAMKLYDMPIRSWLKSKFLTKIKR
ncbi:acyltransferase [Fulvivirga ulvae]|uniref:acyltransferase family protein n=1 Tax=Fulvivirga ulvae TaxID=2904245 RepID=UPI001F2A80D7|nr:acyltransferase [Fulvivirga ulvae]UII32852.1 acyltransferase [Fulvivirga ulvae]